MGFHLSLGILEIGDEKNFLQLNLISSQAP